MITSSENIGSVLDRMVDDYIENLRQNGSTRKPNIKNLVKVYKPTKKDLKDLLSEYHIMLNDVKSAINEKDEDMVEAWDFLTKTKLNHLCDFVELIHEYLEDNSKIKKRKRQVKPEKMIKNLKYKESHEGIQSIDPVSIIGAKSLVCYNVKYNKISFYTSEEGFKVKGTTLQDFDETSFTKSFGRSKTPVSRLSGMGINAIKMELSKINSKNSPATGRINSDTILLKVAK